MLHVGRKCTDVDAILANMRLVIAVVVRAKECGDGGDAMG
jgi:hypothetical protein